MIKRRLFIKNILNTSFILTFINNICYSINKKNYTLIQNFNSMGTHGKIKLITNNKKIGLQAINHTIKKINKLEKMLTKFSNKSFIGKLNNNPEIEFLAPKKIIYLLKLSEIIKKKSNLKFNICIKNTITINTLTTNYNNHQMFTSFKINKNKVLLHKNYTIDLGAIGKGFTLEEATKILNKYKIYNTLIELGGDIKTQGLNEWAIKLNFDKKFLKKNHINLLNKSLASSGQKIYNKITKQYDLKNHIINPITMATNNNYKLITVIGNNATICDALATACFNTPIQEINILKQLFPSYFFKIFI